MTRQEDNLSLGLQMIQYLYYNYSWENLYGSKEDLDRGLQA